jgi:hypothetical protein
MAVTSKGFDFNRIISFPFKGFKAFEKILVGWLVGTLQFFIPILPGILLMGYYYRLMDRDINEDGELVMPEWKDLWGMFKDGFKLFAVNLIYSLPTLILTFIMVLLYLVPLILVIIFASQGNDEAVVAVGSVFFLLTMISTLLSLLVIVLQFGLSFLLYPAMGQTVADGAIAGGFGFKTWWPVLRKNFVGYLIVVGIFLVLGIVSGFVLQILFLTVIGILVVPAVSFLTQIYSYALMAEAYIGGRALLTAQNSPEQIESEIGE